jgi:hypothetical protein
MPFQVLLEQDVAELKLEQKMQMNLRRKPEWVAPHSVFFIPSKSQGDKQGRRVGQACPDPRQGLE